MKFNLKMMAVAAAMVSVAGSASAAMSTDIGNSSLALVAINTSNGNWYVRDLGKVMNDFVPSSVTPTVGTTITKSTSGYSNFGDAAFATWFNLQDYTDPDTSEVIGKQDTVRWMVNATDNNNNDATFRRLITSSVNAAQGVTNGQLNNYVSSGSAGGIAALFGSSTLSKTGTATTFNGALDNYGLGLDGITEVGLSASLFYAVRSVGTGLDSSSAALTRYGNGNFATISLSSTGDLTYSLAAYTVPPSAVPVPAAAWLFGSGLLSFGAFVRRRTAK